MASKSSASQTFPTLPGPSACGPEPQPPPASATRRSPSAANEAPMALSAHWGKVVHGLEGFGFALLVGLLLLGWRDRARIDITDKLATLTAMFAGILFGVMWEIVEFILDWVRYSDLQKSNSDTMTDLLSND